MKIIFFGTPDYVLPILKALAKKYEIAGVVTQSPKPTGRKQFLTYSPIDTWAYKHRVPIFFNFAKSLPQTDLGICAAYGKIIPGNVIKVFRFGILNIHPSLLPQYRGVSPISAAIGAGEKETGVTIIKMDEEIDHGPIISQFREEIKPDDTTGSLRSRLFERAASVLIELLPAYFAARIKPREQNHSQATYTKVLTKKDGFLDFTSHQSPVTSRNFIRAMDPWPGAWSHIKILGEKDTSSTGSRKILRIKLLKAHLENKKLVLDEVQLEGKTPVSWKQFTQAYPTARFSSIS